MQPAYTIFRQSKTPGRIESRVDAIGRLRFYEDEGCDGRSLVVPDPAAGC